jgi:hypothetical protein
VDSRRARESSGGGLFLIANNINPLFTKELRVYFRQKRLNRLDLEACYQQKGPESTVLRISEAAPEPEYPPRWRH